MFQNQIFAHLSLDSYISIWIPLRLVTFETREGALRAIEVLNGKELEGRPLYVREDRTEIEKEEGFVVFVSYGRL